MPKNEGSTYSRAVNLKKVAKNREILVILYNAICSISIIVACYLSSINLVPSASGDQVIHQLKVMDVILFILFLGNYRSTFK